MRENPASAQGGSNANTTMQHMYQMGLRIAQSVCGIVTTPIEYAPRPFFGTRYFDPIQLMLTWLLMLLLSIAGPGTNHLPFGGSDASSRVMSFTALGYGCACSIWSVSSIANTKATP